MRAPSLPGLGVLLAACLGTACSNRTGPAGAAGPAGPPGCAPAAGAPALTVTLAASVPPHGAYFAADDRPVLTMRVVDACGRALAPSDLGTAQLYLAGPRGSLETRTASSLLNCVTDRNATDHQHHYVNLAAPHYADPAQANLSIASDGTMTYVLDPVSSEAPGTYTAGLWVRSKDGTFQQLVLADLQIGTATVEAYASGTPDAATCRACHAGASSGKMYLQHTFPGVTATGNFSLDLAPVASCQLCHNADGYARAPTVQVVHGVHRGASLSNPGVAHPEYGLGAYAPLAEFTDVVFPSMPAADRDCAACHADQRWASKPSRLACGTCHDDLFFDTGTLSPPRVFGLPGGVACTDAASCATFSVDATCDAGSGACVEATHPPQTDDSQCASCHGATTGVSPVVARHDIPSRTQARGLVLSQLSVTGGSGAGGAFEVGDVPVLWFRLADATGNTVTDLATSSTTSLTVVVSGPEEDRQRVYGPISARGGTATAPFFDASSGLYRLALPTPWPANALPPLGADPATAARPNPPGSYTVYASVTQSLVAASGEPFRDTAGATVDVAFGADATALVRQVASTAACDGCHVRLAAHGGAYDRAEGCGTCHTTGALDRGVGSRGARCTVDADCAGFAAGWEQCLDTNNDTVPDTCVATTDPTPGAAVDFATLAHRLHFARLLGGWAERGNVVAPGRLEYLGYGNVLTDASHGLLPQDVRNCGACHADAGNACASSAQCGYGQACEANACVNAAWRGSSSRACLSCHDTQADAAHAALETWTDPSSGPVEACDVCHGPGAAFSVGGAHQIADPYVPPYPREP